MFYKTLWANSIIRDKKGFVIKNIISLNIWPGMRKGGTANGDDVVCTPFSHPKPDIKNKDF